MTRFIKKSAFLSAIIILTGIYTASAQEGLHARIAAISKEAKGIVGVSVLNIETHDTLNYNANAQLVMQSVMKFPLAMAVLHLVDSGVYTLNQTIHIKKRDMDGTLTSVLRQKYPKGDIDVSVSELLSDMISQSDNVACDVLLAQIGGPQQVNNYLRSIKIKGINLAASEAEQNDPKNWQVQYTNWCKPLDMVRLLRSFYAGKALQPASRDFLYKLMTETTTGPNRIKGLLPQGTVVAHKTGSSGTNDEGLSPATNDVGIITLPNGHHVAIAILVCNSTADEATREGVIAKIAKAVYDNAVTK
jgi:beta-lactamase class A